MGSKNSKEKELNEDLERIRKERIARERAERDRAGANKANKMSLAGQDSVVVEMPSKVSEDLKGKTKEWADSMKTAPSQQKTDELAKEYAAEATRSAAIMAQKDHVIKEQTYEELQEELHGLQKSSMNIISEMVKVNVDTLETLNRQIEQRAVVRTDQDEERRANATSVNADQPEVAVTTTFKAVPGNLKAVPKSWLKQTQDKQTEGDRADKERADKERAAKEAEIRAKNIDIIEAADKGRIADVKLVLQHAPERVNDQDPDGATALHYATVNNSFQVAAVLVAAKANVDIKDEDGLTALDYAKQFQATWANMGQATIPRFKTGSSNPAIITLLSSQ